MRLIDKFRLKLRSLFSRQQVERELDEEMRYHLERQTDENIAAGMNAEEARYAALRSIRNMEQRKEECRDARGLGLLRSAEQDVRFTFRQLRKNPGFTATAILMLALGICASVAIFAFVDAALIQPLPYRSPERLVGVFESVPLFPQSNLSYLDYLDWKRLNKVFSSLDAYQAMGSLLATSTATQPVRGARVTAGFFHTLGVTPVLGRDFRAGEDQSVAPRTALLSYAAWQKRYGGKKSILGQTVRLDGEPNTIIGVLPPGFHFAPAGSAEFWTAIHAAGSCDLRRSCHNLYGVARLKPGVSVRSAQAAMQSIAKELEKQYPDSNRGQGASILPLEEVIVGHIRPLLLLLLSGAGLLLLIACVNIASLLLVRSESRKREFAVRSALGASRARLLRQFITEGCVLAATGTVLGLLSSYWIMQLLTKLIPDDMMAHMPYLQGLGFSGDVAVYAAGVSLLAAVLFSAAPAVHLSLTEMREGLTEGSRGSSGNTWRHLGSKLVVLELATALVLLVGAGLLGQSFYRLLQVDLGFQSDHLVTLDVGALKAYYAKDQQAVALARQVVSRLSALPGVKSVGLSSRRPVSGNGNTDWIRFVGRPYHGEHNEVNERDVSAGFFTTLQAKLLRGRYFTDAEDGSKPRVVIINQALAKKYFPGQNPIGQRIGDTDLSPKSIKQIIGVVDDIREGSLDSVIWPAVYYPLNQDPDTYFSVIVRTSQSGRSLLPSLTAAIHRINPDIVTSDGATLNELIHDSPSAYLHRSAAWLVGGFAVVALLLSVIGLYGVIAYSVSQRTREIGVRMALGAQPKTVYRLILTEALWLAGAGIVLGVAGSLAATRLMRSLLFGVRSWDIPTLAIVAAVLVIAALLASHIPARRAASVDPIEALRTE